MEFPRIEVREHWIKKKNGIISIMFPQAGQRLCPAACLAYTPSRQTELFHQFVAQFGVGAHDQNVDSNSIFSAQSL